MYGSIEEELFFSQKVILKRKYSNKELKLRAFFEQETGISLDNLILIKNFIFFFVKTKHYFNAKKYLKRLRTKLKRKILIIRAEKTLKSLIYSFFPDTFVYDLDLKVENNGEMKVINVYLLSYEERGIAVGRGGDYIKAINEIFTNHVVFEEYATFEKYKVHIKVQCLLKDISLKI